MIEVACDIAKKIFPEFKYGWLAEEFRAKLPTELDFTLEAKNAKRCAQIFKDNKRVHVPKIYSEFTFGRMLVMSFETGISVAHVSELHA